MTTPTVDKVILVNVILDRWEGVYTDEDPAIHKRKLLLKPCVFELKGQRNISENGVYRMTSGRDRYLRKFYDYRRL